nr:hypothetical protein CFP56_24062 [Quercus suber]
MSLFTSCEKLHPFPTKRVFLQSAGCDGAKRCGCSLIAPCNDSALHAMLYAGAAIHIMMRTASEECQNRAVAPEGVHGVGLRSSSPSYFERSCRGRGRQSLQFSGVHEASCAPHGRLVELNARLRLPVQCRSVSKESANAAQAHFPLVCCREARFAVYGNGKSGGAGKRYGSPGANACWGIEITAGRQNMLQTERDWSGSGHEWRILFAFAAEPSRYRRVDHGRCSNQSLEAYTVQYVLYVCELVIVWSGGAAVDTVLYTFFCARR